MTREQLLAAIAVLPPETTLTVTVAELRQALEREIAPPAPDPEAGDGEEGPDFLTTQEVATRLRVSRRWVWNNKAKLGGRLLSHNTLRFPRGTVERYLARRGDG